MGCAWHKGCKLVDQENLLAEDTLRKLRKSFCVLRLLLTVDETSAPYNQFSVAARHHQQITLVTYHKVDCSMPKEITLVEGDGSLQGYLIALRTAVHHRTYDIVHIHAPHLWIPFLLASVLMMRVELLCSTVFTVHTSYPNLKFRNRLMLVPAFMLCRRIVFCSHSSLQSFPKVFRWLAGKRISVIENGADIGRVDQALRNSLDSSKDSCFTIIVIGRLIELKNVITIVRAFSECNDHSNRVVFVGEGPLRQALTSESERLGIAERVEVTGLIPREQVYEYMKTANLFISASRVEGLPIAVLEAMACRCPVVLSDIPPHREIAEDTDFIRLIQPDNIPGFVHAIGQFQAMSQAERMDVGEKCRRLVERRFSLTAMLSKYEELYNQLSGNTPEVAQRYAR